MPSILELPDITVEQLVDTDLIYVVQAATPGDKVMTVAEFNKSSLPPVFCHIVWGASDQNLWGSLNTWSQLTGWSATANVDTYSMWDSANQRITVQAELEGAFWVIGVVRMDHDSTDNIDRFVLSVRKNNAEVARGAKDTQDYSSFTDHSLYDTVEVMYFDPTGIEGDYYELFVYPQYGGTSTSLRIEADNSTYHQFTAVRVAGRDEV